MVYHVHVKVERQVVRAPPVTLLEDLILLTFCPGEWLLIPNNKALLFIVGSAGFKM